MMKTQLNILSKAMLWLAKVMVVVVVVMGILFVWFSTLQMLAI